MKKAAKLICIPKEDQELKPGVWSQDSFFKSFAKVDSRPITDANRKLWRVVEFTLMDGEEIIATSEQIALVNIKPNGTSKQLFESISPILLAQILSNDGNCFVEVDDCNCGIVGKTKVMLIDNKVILSC